MTPANNSRKTDPEKTQVEKNIAPGFFLDYSKKTSRFFRRHSTGAPDGAPRNGAKKFFAKKCDFSIFENLCMRLVVGVDTMQYNTTFYALFGLET